MEKEIKIDDKIVKEAVKRMKPWQIQQLKKLKDEAKRLESIVIQKRRALGWKMFWHRTLCRLGLGKLRSFDEDLVELRKLTDKMLASSWKMRLYIPSELVESINEQVGIDWKKHEDAHRRAYEREEGL